LQSQDNAIIMLTMIPILKTNLGELYQSDCLELLKELDSEVVDLAFADPPFNLGKQYSSGVNDALENLDYLDWCRSWLEELIRVLKDGGSLFLWNLPKWNLALGAFLSERLTFRNWIAVDIKYSLPIPKRLYPSHYSLLYFVKGMKPAIFHPDRLPVPCCKKCGGELKDYGGYKDKMNPLGVNISDVWTDIPPVRHAKYKRRLENALSLKLLDRVVSMASDPGSMVLDPFGGSGTTYVCAELKSRRWIGSELDCAAITQRFSSIEADRDYLCQIESEKNTLFTRIDLLKRKASGRPLSPKYRLNGITEAGLAESTNRQLDLPISSSSDPL
jgi:site-specific DNA-methyltransferase (adenine-specific)